MYRQVHLVEIVISFCRQDMGSGGGTKSGANLSPTCGRSHACVQDGWDVVRLLWNGITPGILPLHGDAAPPQGRCMVPPLGKCMIVPDPLGSRELARSSISEVRRHGTWGTKTRKAGPFVPVPFSPLHTTCRHITTNLQ